jgi:hypothetical protein
MPQIQNCRLGTNQKVRQHWIVASAPAILPESLTRPPCSVKIQFPDRLLASDNHYACHIPFLQTEKTSRYVQ